MRTSDRAWIALALGVAAYDVACPPGELLSQASARYADRHPVLWNTAIVYVAAHLAHVIPERFDPLSRLATALGR